MHKKKIELASINVVPDPEMTVKYFWEKFVYGADPFAPNFALPPVPFYLGLLIWNSGHGTAYAMKMTSSQPKIVDNMKGLLVSFNLIGSQVILYLLLHFFFVHN